MIVVARVTGKAKVEIAEHSAEWLRISIPDGLLPVELVVDRQGAARLARLLRRHMTTQDKYTQDN